jgi:hypothetical protein
VEIRCSAKRDGCRIRQAAQLLGLNIEAAWQDLAIGDVEGHNQRLAEGIRQHMKSEQIGCVVLAQLSMTAFLLSFPDPITEFGVPVFTSGQCGFEFVREFLIHVPGSPG